ncbi:hypothetical protein P43SY_011730 [Pythium insidiosum]|uniref:Uncharacterized protein n=1 Tax=Pythium insidiosum TaxID=114742 RepID=A0AAD5Q1A8_PYTIN|nr:hypothetical protein P43SY_011730 [Pythium insidiosum]
MWKSMMILYLKKKGLLGYVVVDGYNGSQAFTFEDETFPATHFGSRGPTDYSKYYEAIFLKKLRPGDDSGISYPS